MTNEEEAYVTALHSGLPDRAERDLAGLRAFGPPTLDSIKAMTYLETQHLADEAQEWGHRFYMKSAFLPALPDEAVDVLVEHAPRAPDGSECGFSTWAWGRRIADVPEDGTAFTGRNQPRGWPRRRCGTTRSRRAVPELGPRGARQFGAVASDGRYVNDVAEVGADMARTVYGDAKYERLVALKRESEPDNVFRLNQNIQP